MRKFQLGILRNLLKSHTTRSRAETGTQSAYVDVSLCLSVHVFISVFFFLMCLEFCEIFPDFSLIDDLFAILMAKYPESPELCFCPSL